MSLSPDTKLHSLHCKHSNNFICFIDFQRRKICSVTSRSLFILASIVMSECTREVFEFTAILAQLSVTAESTSLVAKQWRGGNIFYQVLSHEKNEKEGGNVLHFKCLGTHGAFEADSRCRSHGQIQIFSLQHRDVNHG